jgi:hypothetical protein
MNMLHFLRKGFYVLDLLVLAMLMMAVGHTVIFDNNWELLLLDYAILLRFNSCFLLYRKERFGILPIALFTLLFGYAVLTGIFDNTIFRMGEYPSIFFNSQPSGGEYIIERHLAGEFWVKCIIYWAWLILILVYGIQSLRRTTITNGYRWYDLAGLAIFKDRAGKQFVKIVILVFIAALIGFQMDEMLSFYALMTLPMVAYYFLNKYLGRKAHWLEYVILAVGLYVYDKAQYKVDNERVEYLVVSAVIILVVCAWMMFRTKKIAISLLTLIIMSVVLPGLSVGYNIYQSMEGARSVNYVSPGMKKGYMYIRRTESVNGKQEMRVGIRDRYRTTVPCKFNIILPDGLYSPFVLCMTEKRDSVYYNIERGYIFDLK